MHDIIARFISKLKFTKKKFMSEKVLEKRGGFRIAAAEDNVKANWFLLILVTLLPLQNVYIDDLPSPIPGLNILNTLVLLAFLVWRSRSELNSPTSSTLNKPILWFIGIYTLSVFTRSFTLGTVEFEVISSIKDVLIPPILFFIVLNSIRDRRGIILALTATMIPLPYMFHVFRAQLAGVASWHYDDDLRLVKGTFQLLGSNEIAAFYAAYVFVLLAIATLIKDTKTRVITGLLLCTSLYCVMYSHSRGAYISFVLALVYFGWQVNKKLTITVAAAVLLFSPVVIGFLPVSVQERFDSIFVEREEQRDESAASRFVLWGYAMQEFAKSPIIGRGYQTFVHANPLKLDTHNYYVKLLAEQGLVGCIAFIIILWRSSRLGLQLYRESDDSLYKALAMGVLGVTASLAVNNMFGDRFSHYPLSSYFYVYMALAIRAIQLNQGSASPVPLVKRKPGPGGSRYA